MQLLYLVFGENVQNHLQANFSILTFLRQGPHFFKRIVVVTDAPAFYHHLQEVVTISPIDAATLLDWQGDYKFFWRAKIKAIEFIGQQRRGRSFGGVTITKQHQMWNAGVVAIPAQRRQETINLALSICDDMCDHQVTTRLIEQFALSVALSETYSMQEARPYIGHYWSTKKEWNEIIGTFLVESHLKQRNLEADITALDNFDFQLNPIKIKTRNTHHRLNRLLNKLLPPRDVEFIVLK